MKGTQEDRAAQAAADGVGHAVFLVYRGGMLRLVATDDAIEATKKANLLLPMFGETKGEGGLTGQEYELIRKKWPTVTVLGFGAGGASRDDVRFIRNVFAKDPAKIAGSFDILSTHPYVNPVPPETFRVKSWGQYSVADSLKDIRDILAKKSSSICVHANLN